MPSDEEKSVYSSSSSSSTSSIINNNCSGSEKTNKKHKYCSLCNRNDYTLSSFDRSIGNELQAIFEVDVIIHTKIYLMLCEVVSCCYPFG